MTYHDNFTLSEALLDQQFLEQLTTSGFDALPTLFPVRLNAAMQIERHISLDGHRVEEYRNSGLMVLSFPEAHRRLLRTTNCVERVNREIKRRTQVASIFPNEASRWALFASTDGEACQA